MEAAGASETVVPIYQNTRRRTPEYHGQSLSWEYQSNLNQFNDLLNQKIRGPWKGFRVRILSRSIYWNTLYSEICTFSVNVQTPSYLGNELDKYYTQHNMAARYSNVHRAGMQVALISMLR